ncbi:uncharacterized protein [Primulina huaijiensis]|uniref:uncharacterized protein n=1 Tax=Primulina huaijiensis TaxID=1492673 RepID=UPI003CC77776
MNTLKPWKVQPLSNMGTRFPSQRLTNDAISTKFCRSATVRILSQISPQSVPTVTIPYTELKDQSADLSGKIEQGFGSNGMGIPSILEVPGYTSLRRNLVQLAPGLANLPDTKKLEVPYNRYNIGWSHDKEQLESGKPDMMKKGSYYANPIFDVPTTELSHVGRYWDPSYCGPNIWPRDAMPELELRHQMVSKGMRMKVYFFDPFFKKRSCSKCSGLHLWDEFSMCFEKIKSFEPIKTKKVDSRINWIISSIANSDH